MQLSLALPRPERHAGARVGGRHGGGAAGHRARISCACGRVACGRHALVAVAPVNKFGEATFLA